MINPHKEKYFNLYMDLAIQAAEQSICTRHKVGCVVVAPSGIISIGFNGMPSGLPNQCEREYILDNDTDMQRLKTDPRVIHAEQNALDKLALQGISTYGCIMFTTRSPCFECAKKLVHLGLSHVYYYEEHDDTSGLDLLRDMNIPHGYWNYK